jgi:DnaK suppressor protein
VFERLVVERAHAAERLRAFRLEFARLVEDSADVGADDEHDIEGASMPFEREQLRATLRQASAEVEEIDAAFARLAAGTYGTCAVCGQPVGAGRLEARPAARTCVQCA